MKTRVLPALIFVGLLAGGGYLFVRTLRTTDKKPADAARTDAAPDENAPKDIDLSREKLATAEIASAPVERRPLQSQLTVPGRLEYDDNRHVEVRIAVAGILTDIRVKPGDRVSKGDVLAVASSPEIGQARADVLKREAEHQLSLQQVEWASQIEKGIETIVEGITSRQTVEDLRRATSSSPLGDFRDKIISAYIKYRLAVQLNAKLDGMAETGVLAARTVLERRSEQDMAESALQGAIEQAQYDCRIKRREAENVAADAGRRLELARQQVRSLLGNAVPANESGSQETGKDLSLIEIRAPMSGQIEKRLFSKTERVDAGDSLFIVADPSSLWVSAEIREQEWSALALGSGSVLKVTVPALGNATFDAKVYYIGREVDRAGNSLPLIGELPNPDGKLRPGLFVQVQLAVGAREDALAVPEAAVQTNDGQTVVYIEQSSGRYRAQLVETGPSRGGWVEIRKGLSGGEKVVTRGAFLLKSEHLLESEP